MKAYTDVEQSKKLAEILPGESADMSYVLNLDTWEYHIDLGRFSWWIVPKYAETKMPRILPCWSLAALLEVLPTIDNGNRNPVICKDIRLNKWHVVYHGTAVEPTIDSGIYDNLVDACVDMVVKLHEQNLI